MQPTPVLLPGKFHGQKSLVSYSPWGCKEWNTTEWLHFHFSFSCTGEGNGNPLQYSCLENPRDRGAWWPAVYEFTQIRTRLTWLSSSNRSRYADDTLFMAESTELKSHMIKVKEECEKAGFKNSTFKKKIMASIPTVQSSSVLSFALVWLCDPMDSRTPGLPVHSQHLEFTQTHVHWVGDANQLSLPLSSPFPPAFNLSQHQGLF